MKIDTGIEIKTVVEEIRKVDEFSVEIVEPQKVVIEKVTAIKTLEDLLSDLKQAQDSLAYITQRHSEEVAPIQQTIDIFQARLDEAAKQGLVSKPIEAIKE